MLWQIDRRPKRYICKRKLVDTDSSYDLLTPKVKIWIILSKFQQNCVYTYIYIWENVKVKGKSILSGFAICQY